VQRWMRRAVLRGLTALQRRARTTDSSHGYPISPNRLARNFQGVAPNQVCITNLADIPTGQGWLYLAATLDMHTRKIVGWSMRQTLHIEIALDALNMAVERPPPAGPDPLR
jgi:putative transposase